MIKEPRFSPWSSVDHFSILSLFCSCWQESVHWCFCQIVSLMQTTEKLQASMIGSHFTATIRLKKEIKILHFLKAYRNCI